MFTHLFIGLWQTRNRVLAARLFVWLANAWHLRDFPHGYPASQNTYLDLADSLNKEIYKRLYAKK